MNFYTGNGPGMKEYSFKELAIGKKAAIEIELTEKVLTDFSKLSGDYSSIHTSREFARIRGLKDRVIHGMFIGALASRLAGMELPGKYGILQSVSLNFHNPCYIREIIILESEIIETIESIKTIITRLKVNKKSGGLVVSGKMQIGLSK